MTYRESDELLVAEDVGVRANDSPIHRTDIAGPRFDDVMSESDSETSETGFDESALVICENGDLNSPSLRLVDFSPRNGSVRVERSTQERRNEFCALRENEFLVRVRDEESRGDFVAVPNPVIDAFADDLVRPNEGRLAAVPGPNLRSSSGYFGHRT